MNDKRITFRVDGNQSIGLGHFYRCFALASIVSNSNKNIVFISKHLPKESVEYIRDHNFRFFKIDQDIEFFETLNQEDIVVLDGYSFDKNYQIEIKAHGAKLVLIDDLHNQEYVADAIINHLPYVVKADYKKANDAALYLGPKYALIRPIFIKQAKIERTIDRINNVFICFGGSDYNNLTMQTIDAILQLETISKINVVTGASYSFLTEMETYKKNSHINIAHVHNANEQQMRDLMLQSDLAIVPSSSILYEAVSCGCKIITCYYAENQKAFHYYLKTELGINSFNDNTDHFQKKELIKQMEEYSLNTNSENKISHLRKQISNAELNLLQIFDKLLNHD